MPSSTVSAPVLPPICARRDELLALYAQLRSGREKPGRYWRIDLEQIGIPQRVAPYTQAQIDAPAIRGGFAMDIAEAARTHAEIFNRAYARAVNPEKQKFAALCAALTNTGAFVYVPAGVDVAEPIVITYRASAGALFPHTLVLAENGARATVIVRMEGTDGSFLCGIAELLTGESAQLSFATEQQLPQDATALLTHGSAPGKDARIEIAVAHLGAHVAVDSIDAAIDCSGSDVQITAVFFPQGSQHVDMITTAQHNAGDAQSQTFVKSAATGSGQARFLGNIRIAPHAQATQASLRDDALLLSRRAHIDSVPALEIAANDVKAFHGATVGALDEEQIFYMVSRGIEPAQAERMIALGFFEPAIERFPTNELRERLRAALEQRTAS